MTGAPGVFRRLLTLKRTFNMRRLEIAYDLMRRGELRMLAHQIHDHTAYRSRLHRLSAHAGACDLPLSVDEPVGRPEPYTEGDWPEGNPLVSVIVPCFNYGPFIAEAVDSVLAQTFQDLEIIVVEGGSTDSITRGIVAALRRPKTRALFRGAPHAAGDNRNFGIAIARGKYICCLDADDLLQQTYIEKAVFLLENYGYDIVSTSVRRFGALSGGYCVLPAPDLSHMVKGNHVTTCAVFRRSFWEKAGGYRDTAPGMPFVHEDWSFWVRLAALGARIVNIAGEQLFWYRAHDHHSLSNRPDILPNRLQARLIREANQDLITAEAFERSRTRAAICLRSSEGSRNLLRHSGARAGGPTILLAVPHLVLGGAERLLSQIVGRLGQSGYRIVIVTTLPAWPELGDVTSWFERATSEIYHLPRFLAPPRWFDFVDYLIRAKRAEALWIVGSAFFYDALPRLKERHPHLRVADLLFNTVGYTYNNRSMAHLIDLTIVESETTRAWLLAAGERGQRIRLIPSGIDLSHYRPDVEGAAVDYRSDLARNTFVVGYSGRLAEEKAPLSFVKIAESIPADSAIRFVMTGAGPLAEDVRRAIQRRGLGERLHFAGIVADVRDYLASYDVLVLPSRIDGRPTVVMEALAMGIPVIASRVGALAELVIHGQTGFLCDPKDIRAFAEHIMWLHGHRRERADMRRAARRFAEANFSLERMEKGYSHVFTELLGIRDGEVSAGIGSRPLWRG